MRRSFVDVLKDSKIDIKKEYDKLYLLFEKKFYDEIDKEFLSFSFRGTCLTLGEFNEKYGFNFDKEPDNFNLDYFINFCEYFYNMVLALFHTNPSGHGLKIRPTFIIDLICRIMDEIGYSRIEQEGFIVLVEESEAVRAVAEIVPADLSTKIVTYNHHSMKENLDEKKNVLIAMANELEAKESALKSVNSSLKDDLFYLFNNLNIRHNNIDPGNGKKFKRYVAEMTKDELEYWYDETYQMCLLAILEVEHAERKRNFKILKEEIENAR